KVHPFFGIIRRRTPIPCKGQPMRQSNSATVVLVVLAAALMPFSSRAQQAEDRNLPAGLTAKLDVEYAKVGDVSLKLDVYQPTAASVHPRPCVVWIHGGGWRSGSKSAGAGRLTPLVATGEYVGASIDYRLIGVAIWPAQIYDCKAAIRYLRANR